MKKFTQLTTIPNYNLLIRFFLLFVTVAMCQATLAQTTCNTASLLPDHTDSAAVPEQQTNTTNWYYFTALETETEIDIYTDLSNGNSNIDIINLWSGNCSVLTLIGNNTLDSINDGQLSIRVTNLIVGSNYFLEVTKSINNNPAIWWVSNSFFHSTIPNINCEYVINSRFENFAQQVTNQDQLNYAVPWVKGNLGTTDYLHSSATNALYSVPSNIAGYQDDFFTQQGDNAYAGFAGHFRSGTVNRHEYVQQQLMSPLLPGVRYWVSFRVSLADFSPYACPGIGIYFSQQKPFFNNAVRLRQVQGGPFVTPQIHSSQPQQNLPGGLVTDQNNWTTIQGIIIGNGERWITIGGFNDNVGPTPNNISSYYLLDDVSVQPMPFTLLPNPISICPGTSEFVNTNPSQFVNWTANNSFINFSCINCNGTTITNMPIGNTLVTASINFPNPMQNCNLDQTVTVNVTNNPTIQVTATPNPIYSGQSSNLQAIYNGATNFSWQPSTGLNLNNVANPIFNYPFTTSYSVNSIISPTCTATGNITVNVIQPICDPEMTINYSTPKNSITVASELFNGSSFVSSSNIFISGTLQIDIPMTFITCNLIMDKDAEIELLNGNTLNISDKTHIYSCTEMWNGIIADNSSEQITISGNSLIEDAKKAVSIENDASLIMDQAILNNNLYGVFIKNSTAGLSPITVKSSVFSSRFILSNKNPALNVDVPTLRNTLATLLSISLKQPFPAVEGAFGIYAENNNYVFIGDCIQKQFYNVFDNLGCGIYGDQSDMDIVNNNFQNIIYSSDVKKGCSGCPTYFGTAIKAVGDIVNSTPHRIYIGNQIPFCHTQGQNYPFTFNKFTEVYDAISVSAYSEIRIENNEFNNVTNISNYINYGVGRQAVWVSEPLSDNLIKIENNTITNFFDGIVVWRNTLKSNLNSHVLIDYNEIQATVSGTCALAISLSDVYKDYSGAYQILGNKIIDTYKGINVTNVGIYDDFSGYIKENEIGIKYSTNAPVNCVGIEILDCENVKILVNCDIYCTTSNIPSVSAADVAGIHIYKSPGCHVISNRIENTTRALTFEGYCSILPFPFIQTKVLSNHMHNSKYGLYMLNNAEIGLQGCSNSGCQLVTENMWYGNFTAHTFVNNNNLNVNLTSKFFIRDDSPNSPSITKPLINGFIPPANPYSVGSSLQNGFEIPTNWTPSQSDVEFEYNCQKNGQIFPRQANRNGIDTLYINLAETELLNILADSSGIDGYEQETRWQSKKYLIDKLNQSPGFIYMNDTLGDFYFNTNSDNIGLLSKANKAFKNADLTAASAFNGAVTSTETIELNQKVVNRLIIKQQQGILFTNVDSSALLGIALQCKLAGGNAVLQARILYCAYYKQFDSFTDNCSNLGARKASALSKVENKVLFKVSPNPSKALFEFEYSIISKTNLIILDIAGRTLKNVALDINQNKTTLNLNEFETGIYFCFLKCGNSNSKVEKLILNK